MPCYLVKDKLATADGPKARIVEAANGATARNFVVNDRFTVEKAEPRELAELVAGGAPYEVATGADEVQEQVEPEVVREEPKNKDDVEDDAGTHPIKEPKK